jgi:hypothetical protein
MTDLVLFVCAGTCTALLVAGMTFVRTNIWRRAALTLLASLLGCLTTSLIFCALGPDFAHTGYAISFTFLIALPWSILFIPVGLGLGVLVKFIISLFQPYEPYK